MEVFMKNKSTHPSGKGRQTWTRTVFALLLALVMMFSLPTQAAAETIIVNGTPGGGIPGATNSESGAYNIRDDDGYIMGVRFTLVKADGTTVGAPTDVYRSSYASSHFLAVTSTLVKMTTKLSKMA